MKAYTIAYAVGYYYGRAYPADEIIPLKDADLAVVNNQGFQDGLSAGRHDYMALDLPAEASKE